jgi:CheY-like chemotaxis protein
MMPGMDGYTVQERLHADPATRDIPVIFVTAMSADEDEEHGLSLGRWTTWPSRSAPPSCWRGCAPTSN